MLRGLEMAGFERVQDASAPTNPVHVHWTVGGLQKKFRLWVFEITHGGGGSEVRAADEFRIQITNGPAKRAAFDSGGYQDLLLGYSPNTDVIVAYDRRWLETWTKRKEDVGTGGSPSVQVKEGDIKQGLYAGVHHLVKQTQLFGQAHIATLRPEFLPGYLFNHHKVLSGQMSATAANANVPSQASDDIVAYCASRGFAFPEELIARYVAAFLAKPFVILAGVSGTGKSKMAELVAEFYTRSAPAISPASKAASAAASGDAFEFEAPSVPKKDRFALVAVRPDWIDNQSVLGFINPITQTYESTQALDLILRASDELNAAASKSGSPRYFMLLDEMNLAKVEHYFSDWLAASESRRQLPDGSISQQSIPLHRSLGPLSANLVAPDGTTANVSVPKNLVLPTNLVVTGTVNVDETTYGISPKVLDRAMVIEFDDVDLEAMRQMEGTATQGTFRMPKALPPFALATDADYRAIPATTHEHLKAINEILEEARLHFGYRSAAEMGKFMAVYNQFLPELPAPGDAGWLRALDIAVLQKILPRLQGNRAKLEKMLVCLCAYLRDLTLPPDLTANTAFDPGVAALLPKSYTRALEMLESLRDFGFVSFFK